MIVLIRLAFSWLAGIVGAHAAKYMTAGVLIWVAGKALSKFFVFVALPIIMYNVATDWIFDMAGLAANYVATLGLEPQILELTGMGGWMAQQLRLAECMSIYLTAVSVRFAMQFIPRLGGN